MEVLLSPASIFAVCTAVAGVVLFALSPYLKSPLPPSITRLVGVWAVGAALVPIWVLTESWLPPAVLGGVCLLAMVVVHVLQTRKNSVAPDGGTPRDGE